MVTVYYIKRVQISQPREEVPSPGKVHGVFSCPLPVKLWAEVTSPTTMYDTTHGVLPTREAYLSLSVQFLLGLQSHRHDWPPMWLTFSFQALWRSNWYHLDHLNNSKLLKGGDEWALCGYSNILSLGGIYIGPCFLVIHWALHLWFLYIFIYV